MNTTGFDHDDHDGIRQLLLGRTVAKVADDKLTLDDGTVLHIVPNEGGCSCGAGDYELTELNDCPTNAIMNVEFEVDCPNPSKWEGGEQFYRIFVYAANEKIKLMEVAGDDGNGYYGTGYWIGVTR